MARAQSAIVFVARLINIIYIVEYYEGKKSTKENFAKES